MISQEVGSRGLQILMVLSRSPYQEISSGFLQWTPSCYKKKYKAYLSSNKGAAKRLRRLYSMRELREMRERERGTVYDSSRL